MGSLASIENLSDSQRQLTMRGHDMQVSALAVSPSGKLIASGQVGTRNFKGNAGPSVNEINLLLILHFL